MSFPDIRIGICQVCGTDGRDQTADLTGADAPARALTGNGIELEKFEGKLLCPVCINEAKANRETANDIKKQIESNRFRSKAGFRNTV